MTRNRGLGHLAYFGVVSFKVTRNFFPFDNVFPFTSGLSFALSPHSVETLSRCCGSTLGVVTGAVPSEVPEPGSFAKREVGLGLETRSLGNVGAGDVRAGDVGAGDVGAGDVGARDVGAGDVGAGVDGDAGVSVDSVSWIGVGILTCGVGLSKFNANYPNIQ